MQRYILNNSNSNPTECLDVIPDYTQALSEAEMKNFMMELVSVYEDRDVQSEHYWKGLWQKFNLLRLYCQYRPDNRDVFCSIKGYEYLSRIVDGRFCNLFRQYLSSCDVLKELGRLLDLIGLKDTKFPLGLLSPISTVLSCLISRCNDLKIQSMVLRIYRRMFYDLNIETLPTSRLDHFCFSTVNITLYTLERENFRDIANEDLYNGMATLNAAWMKNRMSSIKLEFDYVGVLVDSVTLCIARFHYLHQIARTDEEGRPKKSIEAVDEEAAKNVDLISVALERGLSLINSILTTTSQGGNELFRESKEKVQASDIVTEIVRLLDLVLAGFKRVGTSHLKFGINIVVALVKEDGSQKRNDVVRVFGDFLGSNILDEYDSEVKLLLQEFIQNANLSEHT